MASLERMLLAMILFFILPASGAETLSPEKPLRAFFEQLNSPHLEVLSRASPEYEEGVGVKPWLDRLLAQDSLRFDPDVAAEPTSPECQLAKLQEQMLHAGSFAGTSGALADYVRRCESQVQLPQIKWLSSISNLYRTMLVRYWPLESPYGREVMLHLPGDLRVKGYLAMKGDGRPRPLVLFRLGIFSRASSFAAETFEFMHLFEGSPFNVLVLESTTGPDFLRRNAVVNFAGFDEGVQDYQIAQLVQNPREPLARFIQDVQMVGMSLGGNGMFFAALLNEWAQRQHRPALFSGFMGLCPLVDLKSTWGAHQGHSFFSHLVQARIEEKMSSVKEKIPGFPAATLLTDLEPFLRDYYVGSKSLTSDLPLPAEMREHTKDFWWLNDFWPRFRNLRQPILIFATRQDPLVPFALNSGRLLSREIDLGTTPYQVIPLSEGVHCSLPGAYQWKALTIWQQSYLLSQSPDFHVRNHHRELHLNWGSSGGPEAQSPLIHVVATDRPEVLLWQILSAVDGRILGQMEVPFLEMGWGVVPLEMVQKSLQRWAQQNVRWTWLDQGQAINARADWFE